jgi:hypothetical protein
MNQNYRGFQIALCAPIDFPDQSCWLANLQHKSENNVITIYFFIIQGQNTISKEPICSQINTYFQSLLKIHMWFDFVQNVSFV